MAQIIISRPKESEMCPVGYHVVKGHWRHCASGTKTWVDAHIRENEGSKGKQMYLSENLFFLYWKHSQKYPSINAIKGFPSHHNIDPVIHFWLNYWKKQEVTFPRKLTPLHIKAMIAAESSLSCFKL